MSLQTCNAGAVHTLTITTPFGTAVQVRLFVVNRFIRHNVANCNVSDVIIFFNAVFMLVKIYSVRNFPASFCEVLPRVGCMNWETEHDYND